MSSSTYTGNASRKARAICKARLPAPCWRGCGRIIQATDPAASWHAGHIIDRALGGTDAPDNLAAECASCNTSAGGKLAQQLKADKRDAGDKLRPSFWFPPKQVTR